jgi:hypothetical protein
VERDIKLRRVNVAEVPIADVRLGATHKARRRQEPGGTPTSYPDGFI